MDFKDGRPKTEPNADMRNMAQVAWQMYVALKDQGFDETQAMHLVTEILTAGMGNKSES